MSLQRIIAVLGSALLVTTTTTMLIGEPSARADQDQPVPGQRPTDVSVHFEFDSAELDARAKRNLDAVAAWLQENPQRTVVVAGYTDQVGDEDYNLVLGKERARRTKQYLVSRGVEPERIITVSFGEDFPASSEDAENRRIVFYSTRPGVDEEGAMQQEGEDYQQPGQPGAGGETGQGYGTGEPPLGTGAQEGQGSEEDGDFGMEVEDEEAPAGLFGAKGKRSEELVKPYGISLSAGGGVIGFVDGDTRDFADSGGTWDVRVTFGTRRRLAVEAVYFGSTQGVATPGLTGDASLLGTGLEGNLRINVLRQRRFQPYLLSGVGWTRYGLRNVVANTSNLKDSESLLHVPFAVGVGFRATRSFLVDLRGTMRAAFRDDLQRAEPNGGAMSDADLTTWSVTARLGWEF